MPTSAKIGVGLAIFSAACFAVVRFKSPEESTDVRRQPSIPRFGFREVGEAWGLHFLHNPGHPTFFYPEIMGAGLAVADFDNDGRLDILLRGAIPGKGHPFAKIGPTSRLYLQRQARRFENASEKSGLDDDGYAMGVAVGDVNNDGNSDVYLCNFGKDKLYLGLGDGTFIDATKSSGIANAGFASSACFVDFDRDGLLDLYVANYVHYPKFDDCESLGRRDYCKPGTFQGLPHKLYRNVTPRNSKAPDVKFLDVSDASGVGKKPARGLGVILCDPNEDGWPDLYLANDDEPNFLWVNQKNGKFLELAAAEGVAVNGAGQSQGSMGLAEADVDGDGALDVLVTNFRAEYTTLYCRQAYGFQDRSGALGVGPLTRPFTGFGVTALDVDGDGIDEIIQANGRVTQLETEPAVRPPKDPNATVAIQAFWNAYSERSQLLFRTNDRFEDAKDDAGAFGRWVGIGRGLAVGDFDGNGWPDLAAIDFGNRAKLFLNESRRRGRLISIRAVNPSHGGRDALGAVVTVVIGEKRMTKRIRSCGSYQSASEPKASFGLGDANRIDRIEIKWPDGDLAPEVFDAPKLEGSLTIQRGQGTKKT